MNEKKTNNIRLVADIIVPAAVILVTTAIFFLFIPEEPGTLFWSNLVYTIFLEFILLTYIVWLPAHGSSVVLKWVGGVNCMLYVATALVWMLIYGVLLQHWASIKIYYAVIAILTVFWLFASSLSFKVDNDHKTANETLSANRSRAEIVNSKGEMYLQQFNMLLGTYPELGMASGPVTSLCHNLSSMSPVIMGVPEAAQQINDICRKLEDLISEPASEDVAERLKNFSENSLLTINYLKKSVRK